MRQIFLYTIPALIVGASVYAIPNPTPEELIEKENRQAIMDCVDSLSGTSLDIQKGTIECSKTPFRSITGTHSTGITVPPPSQKVGDSEQRQQNPTEMKLLYGVGLDNLHEKVCKKQINSPLCKDRALFDRLYRLTEERLPNKQFFPILVGITNAESSLGLDFAKDKVGGTCIGRNNWGGTKYQIHDDNTRTYSRELNGFLYGQKYSGRFVDQFGCNLYPFESVEEFWITKVNGMRYGYPGCIESKTPIRCLSYKYVGSPDVAEESWIKNVSVFLD